MIKLFRRRHAIDVQGVTLCEPCRQVCTSACRTDARYERTRTTLLANVFVR